MASKILVYVIVLLGYLRLLQGQTTCLLSTCGTETNFMCESDPEIPYSSCDNPVLFYNFVKIVGPIPSKPTIPVLKKEQMSGIRTKALYLTHLGIQCLDKAVFQSLAPYVEILDLSKNRLTGLPGSIFRGFLKLIILDLSHNLFKKIPKFAFQNLQGLQQLTLLGNKLVEIGLLDFKQFVELRTLDLSFNRLTTVPHDSVRALAKLETLSLSGNSFHCGCNLIWIRYFTKCLCTSVYDNCTSPEEFRLSSLDDFPVMNCSVGYRDEEGSFCEETDMVKKCGLYSEVRSVSSMSRPLLPGVFFDSSLDTSNEYSDPSDEFSGDDSHFLSGYKVPASPGTNFTGLGIFNTYFSKTSTLFNRSEVNESTPHTAGSDTKYYFVGIATIAWVIVLFAALLLSRCRAIVRSQYRQSRSQEPILTDVENASLPLTDSEKQSMQRKEETSTM